MGKIKEWTKKWDNNTKISHQEFIEKVYSMLEIPPETSLNFVLATIERNKIIANISQEKEIKLNEILKEKGLFY
ncbi:MAG: hypothetical protein WC934_04765 [Acidithiobacillus sp.]|jgi:hypothetical protein|uniref:hypothetical protein n=1 Tax=Acidithiobacillus sp. TaxID=1872118 RepID=UPI00355DEE4F